jgi:hypothetical protein
MMTARITALALLLSVPVLAQDAAKASGEKSAPAPAAVAAAAPAAPAATPQAAPSATSTDVKAAAGDRSDWKQHSQAAQAFLKSWGKGKWAEAKAVSGADTVELKIAGKSYTIDVANGNAGAKLLLPFHGLSSIREDGIMKGVAISELTLMIGDAPPVTSKARVLTDIVGGEAKVVAVELE